MMQNTVKIVCSSTPVFAANYWFYNVHANPFAGLIVQMGNGIMMEQMISKRFGTTFYWIHLLGQSIGQNRNDSNSG